MRKYIHTARWAYLVNLISGAKPANLQKKLAEQGFRFEGVGTRVKNWGDNE